MSVIIFKTFMKLSQSKTWSSKKAWNFPSLFPPNIVTFQISNNVIMKPCTMHVPQRDCILSKMLSHS